MTANRQDMNVSNTPVTSRRKFIQSTMAAGGLALAPFPAASYLLKNNKPAPLEIHLFSKHLHFLNWQEAGAITAELGFSGLDLTVRPGGHVLPEKVGDELPLALEQIRLSGIACRLISTAVSQADDPEDLNVLKTAASNGIAMYRSAWYPYNKEMSMPESIEFCRRRIAELSAVSRELGLTGCYQNHAGDLIGASLWEVHQLLSAADPSAFGIQYDVRHATVEGGLSWMNGLRLVKGHIKTIGLKDFKWGQVNGKWQVINTPIGEGMVDFKAFFSFLKQENIAVPAVLYMEYPLGGAEEGSRELTIDRELVYEAMQRDLRRINRLWEEA